jgi:putative transposase
VPRKHREQVAGGVYHVYARGNKRADIFVDDIDRRTYLALLGRTVQQKGWRLMAYCLMPNHVHLLVETPEPDLGDGMRRIHGVYAQTFNERHAEVGHVFQGRYGSTLVTSDEQLVAVVGYIVHNPVKAGLVERAEAWGWSSHAAMAGKVVAPAWLAKDRLLELLGVWGGDPREGYREVVEGRRAAWGVTVSTSLVNVGEGPKSVGGSAVRNR